MGESRVLKIGLDFDDTLMQTREALVALLNEMHKTNVRAEECTDYYLSEPWNLTDEQFAAMFNAHEDHIHTQPPLEGLLETLQAWSSRGSFHVVTGRPERWLPSAISWMRRHNIQIEQVISARTVGGKGAAAQKLGLNFFIEDHAEFALEIANAGTPVFLLDRPYNQQGNHPLITRVKDWHQIRDLVDNKFSLQQRASAAEPTRDLQKGNGNGQQL
ncbi:MAG: 5' nucleotidase, NT5C type [Phycisphaerae bacterium]